MVYKWYILPTGGLYATYHLLREPASQPSTLVQLKICIAFSTAKGGGNGDIGAILGAGVMGVAVAMLGAGVPGMVVGVAGVAVPATMRDPQ